jgi:hypothetical protein
VLNEAETTTNISGHFLPGLVTVVALLTRSITSDGESTRSARPEFTHGDAMYATPKRRHDRPFLSPSRFVQPARWHRGGHFFLSALANMDHGGVLGGVCCFGPRNVGEERSAKKFIQTGVTRRWRWNRSLLQRISTIHGATSTALLGKRTTDIPVSRVSHSRTRVSNAGGAAR